MQEKDSMPNTGTPFYDKGRRYYHIGSYSLVGIILISVALSFMPYNATINLLRSVLFIVLALAAYITIPIALINVVRSIRRKEPVNKYRTYYLIAIVFLQTCLILLLVFIALGLLQAI